MAVQSRRFSHDLTAAVGGGGPLFLDDYAGGCGPAPALARVRDTTVLRDLPRSDLACDYGFVPRKRPRLAVAAEAPAAAGGDSSLDHPPAPAGVECLVPAPPFADERSGAAVGSSAAASTSGRVADGAAASPGLLSWMYHQGVEIDALVRLEAERLRAGLEESRRRHARALLAAAGRAASGRLRAAEAGLERALRRNAELEEKARQAGAECQAWMGVAKSHEAVAAGLRATLDQLLQSPPAGCEGEAAEDAQSCCFDAPPAHDNDRFGSRSASSAPCRSCGRGEACVLLLPCRHLCLCRACEPAVDACIVCAATKNGSLHVLFS